MISFLNKKGQALKLEKQKDYRNVVFVQIALILCVFTVKEILVLIEFEYTRQVSESIFLVLGGIYLMMLWDMLKNFTQSQWLINITLIMMSVGFILGVVFTNPFYEVLDLEGKRKMLLLIHSLLFSVEVTVVAYTIRDIFITDSISGQKLWGAACIYLMFGIAFGSLFDLICILKTGALGVTVPLGLESYFQCIYFSFTILAAIDNPFPDAIKIVHNIALIQAIWSNLFIVLIVGRILGQPDSASAPK